MLVLILFLLLAIFIACYVYRKNILSLSTLKNRHVLITGGSKGIGLELAKIAVQNAAHVTIVARDKNCLDAAKNELEKFKSNPNEQNILTYSLDVCNANETIDSVIRDAVNESGPIYLLACCAGNAIAKTFSDSTNEDFHRMMNVNYFGTVNIIKACLPSLKNNQNGSHILLFSSLAGIFGLYGYSAYAASKFALTGLAEVLDMELRPFNINITVSFPPDTDTPGYKMEQIDKPHITKLISEEGGIYSAGQVAKQCLYDTISKKFTSTVGISGFFLINLCSGMMPARSWFQCLFQVFTMGLLRLVGLQFLYSCQKTIEKNISLSDKKK